MARQQALQGQYRDETRYLGVGLALASEITGIPEADLAAARTAAAGADEDRDPGRWSDGRLARAAMDRYPGTDSDTSEFRLRFPEVAALLTAMEVLFRRDPDQPEGGWPVMDLPGPAPAGWESLRAEYRARLTAIIERASWPDGDFKHSGPPATWL